ncbi:MAG: hypothetical protein KF831_08175 [Acidobacteria bacterium]|nr:hypothetical protein [Acidobacteriota bacterium]
MRIAIAAGYTLFALFGLVAGYVSNSGPLDYIFSIIAGIPWTQFLSWLFASTASPIIRVIGVLINLVLVWVWAIRPRRVQK